MSNGTNLRVIRVAVLECLKFADNISCDKGNFTEVFEDWLNKSAQASTSWKNVQIRCTGYDVVGKQLYPGLDMLEAQFDALIVTGSMEAAYDEFYFPWIKQLGQYLEAVYERHPKVRIYGGCFGHQIIAQALLGKYGVEVVKEDWEVGVHQVTLSPGFRNKVPLLQDGASMSCQFLHSDHVVGFTGNTNLPSEWMNIGKSNLCEIQGLYKPGRVLTFQGHPEFDQFITQTTVTNLKETFKADYKKHLDQAGQSDDALLYGEVLINFFISG
ncbi:class I glutamine amidotransferase-like protein [Pestalotiopsis sp. NC0098]|nr:class I glutamine amidotransferase-like protein [Pestalotiopsis sp. NC0098]